MNKPLIYFDNAATTLKKPPSVGKTVLRAINAFGNPGRSFHAPAAAAAREVYAAREEIARLTGLSDPLRVAFTSSATESLNLIVGALLEGGGSVVSTVLEHNSVLRPLYRNNCCVSFLDCDGQGRLLYDELHKLITPETQAVFANHGSNVTGMVTDAYRLHEICAERGVPLVLDVSQSLGSIPVSADMADILCFTGHKGLFGPQGTGGIILPPSMNKPLKIIKTGGTGYGSFDRLQSATMPDLFEAGTANSHGLSGLRAGTAFINAVGVEKIHKKETLLVKTFWEGVCSMPGILIYGDFSDMETGKLDSRLPIVSLNIKNYSSAYVAEALWEEFGIAVRPGVHCAPLLHSRLGTEDRGAVRFSFSCFNSKSEILAGIEAVRALASREGGEEGEDSYEPAE